VVQLWAWLAIGTSHQQHGNGCENKWQPLTFSILNADPDTRSRLELQKGSFLRSFLPI
jgi:hypothetical protein